MSIFTKPLSKLETSDLHELLQDQAIENLRLEFKLEAPGKDETLKKISSFANTFGGFVVVGAEARSADGRIESLPGVDEQPGYKQKIVQWSFDAVSPPLNVDVSDPIPAPSGNGKVCYVIYTAESDVAPHFLNGRKGIWIRTNEFSGRYEARLADESELRLLFDRRKLIRERRDRILKRAKERFDTYLSKKHTDRSGNRTKTGSLLDVSFAPRFPARQLCEQEQLKLHIQNSWTDWRQVRFPDPGSPILSQNESAIVLNPAKGTSFFEASIWGSLFYATRIDQNEGGYFGIHSYEVVGHLILFIRHANKMLQALGYSGPLLIETSLSSVKDVPWLHGAEMGRALSSRPGSALDDNFTFSIYTTTEDLAERPDRTAIDMVRSIFFSANRSEMVESVENVEELLRIGYQFNFWPRPTALRTQAIVKRTLN